MRTRSIWLLLFLGLSCTATPSTTWLPEAANEPVTWRQLRLYRGQDASVLASQESVAAEVHQLVARARAAAADAMPPRSLVIAVSETDAPLFAHADDYERALGRWGATTNMGKAKTKNGKEIDVDRLLVLRMAVAVAPIDDVDLDLPAALREQFTHVMITPCKSCIEAACEAMVEAAFDAEDIGWVKRQLVYAVMDPRAMMAEKMRPAMRAAFAQSWATATGLSREHINAVRAEFDLPKRVGNLEAMLAGETYRLLPPDEARIELMSLAGMRLDADLQLGVSAVPSIEHLFAMHSLRWSMIVDLNLQRLARREILRGRPAYRWRPLQQFLPDRADAEAFEQMRREQPGFALVFADDVNRAAALLAMHAFWVRELDADAAIAIGLRFGLDAKVASAVRERLVR